MIDENGENLGLMSLAQGVELAKEKAYDLVQISPTEEPVCRLMDFNKTMEEKARSKVASLVCLIILIFYLIYIYVYVFNVLSNSVVSIGWVEVVVTRLDDLYF